MNILELHSHVKSIFGIGKSSLSYDSVKCKFEDNNSTLVIELQKMYEHVKVRFEHLEKLSKLLGTQNINLGNREVSSGCPTCDFGSSYRVSIYIMNVKTPIER